MAAPQRKPTRAPARVEDMKSIPSAPDTFGQTDRPVLREPAREAAPNLVPGRAVGYTRDGRAVQRTAAAVGTDQFAVPAHLPPPGRTFEWKTETVYGQPDPFRMSQYYKLGWEPVMYEQHPGQFAPEVDGSGERVVGPVRRGGMMLMERDANLTQEAIDDEVREAARRTGDARKQYSRLSTDGAPTAEIDREAMRASTIRQHHEPDTRPRVPVD